MPTNDFLPIATSAGANVKTQAAYAALTSLLANGFSSGVVDSPTFNKALRQSSFVAAALAQMVADNQSNNVADDGVIANFETNLIAAIRALVPGAFVYSKASPGYVKLPGGVIIQWGSASTNSSGSAAVTFPTPFPAACALVLATGAASSAQTYVATAGSATQTGMSVSVANGSGTGIAVGATWLAIGY